MIDLKSIRALGFFIFIFGAFNPLKGSFGDIVIYFSDAVVFLGAVVAFVGLSSVRKPSLNFSLARFIFVVLFFSLAIVSTLLSGDGVRSGNLFLDYLKLYTCFLLLIKYLEDGEIKWLLGVVFVWSLFVGGVQIATGSNFGNLGSLFGDQSVQNVTFMGLTSRIPGTASHPNVYAQLLVVGYVFYVGTFIEKKKFVFSLAIFVATLAVLLGTLSRAGLAFFVFANFLLFMMYLMRAGVASRSVYVLYAFLVLGGVYSLYELGLFALLSERANSTEDLERTEMLLMAIEMLGHQKVLWFGTGLGNFFGQSAEYGLGYTTGTRHWLDLSATDVSVHNVFVLWIVEMGVLAGGLLVFAYLREIILSVIDIAKGRGDEFCVVVVSSLVPFSLYMSSARYPMLYVFGVVFLFRVFCRRRVADA